MDTSHKTATPAVVARAPPRLVPNRYLQQIHAEQVRLLFEQLPTALIATMIVGGLFVYVLWTHVPRLWLATWLLGLAATTLAREWLRRAYLSAKRSALEVGPWVRRFVAGVVVSGALWGIAGAFPISPNDVVAEMFRIFVLAGLAAGGMPTLSSLRGAYAAFLVPAILPFAIKLML